MGNTGVAYHAANFHNTFTQIHGVKRWTLVHPDYTFGIMPMLNDKFMDMATFVTRSTLKRKPEEFDKYLPVYHLLPKYVIDVQPGNCLINPPWYCYSNSFASFVQSISPSLWKTLYSRFSNPMG